MLSDADVALLQTIFLMPRGLSDRNDDGSAGGAKDVVDTRRVRNNCKHDSGVVQTQTCIGEEAAREQHEQCYSLGTCKMSSESCRTFTLDLSLFSARADIEPSCTFIATAAYSFFHFLLLLLRSFLPKSGLLSS